MEANRVAVVPVVRVISVMLLLSLGCAVVGDGVGGAAEAAGAARPQAAAPTVAVSPEHVGDGVYAEMVVSGFPEAPPDGATLLIQCDGEVTTAPVTEAPALCTVIQTLATDGPPPTFAVWRVGSSFTTFDQSRVVDCATEPSGCVAGAATLSDPIDDPTSVIASAFDDLEFSNAVTGVPTGGLEDGDTVAVQGVGMTPGDWSIAQCGRALLADPTPERAAALCAAPMPVTVSDGAFEVDLVVHDPLTSTGGGSLSCDPPGCVVVMSSSGDLAASHFGISFGPTSLRFAPDRPLPDGARVTLTTQASVSRELHARQCALPLGPTLPESRCGYLDAPIVVADTGEGTATTFARSVIFTPDGELDCRVESCAYAAFDASGQTTDDPTVAVSPALELLPLPSVTIEPSDGLLDGDSMTVTGHDLIPNIRYHLLQCAPRPRFVCAPPTEHLVGPDGTLQATRTASQVLHRSGYCRTDCLIRLQPLAPFGDLATGSYSMAAGSLAATPDRGLSDGQTVRITGEDLMPTYDGPSVFGFPTGGWALTQCDSAIFDDPTLLGAFTHCSAAPPTRAVTIDGSTLDTDIDVNATISRILGGTTDCTDTPGACVVGLVRFELDGSLSTHLAPTTFA
jgi:hypothetical protein